MKQHWEIHGNSRKGNMKIVGKFGDEVRVIAVMFFSFAYFFHFANKKLFLWG